MNRCSRKLCKRSSSSGSSLCCRCGTVFCSEACFVSAWHVDQHKVQCPHAEAIEAEAARDSAKLGAAALCAAALDRARPVECSLPATHPSASPTGGAAQILCAEVGSKSLGCSSSTTGPSARSTAYVHSIGASSSNSVARPSTEPSSSGGFDFDDFSDVGSLGCGSYGQVRRVVHRRTNATFALKIIPKHLLHHHGLMGHLEREATLQSKLCHPNVVQLYDRFEDDERVGLLLEWASGGSLFQALRKSPNARFQESQAGPVFVQIAEALSCLHENGVIHRDLKPENILICSGGVAKLADFGWCAELHSKSPTAQGTNLRSTFCGTFDYLSPEMIHDEPHGCGVDIWAMGVLLYEMLVGRPPFSSRSQAECVARISRAEFDGSGGGLLSAQAASVIGYVLVRNAIERPSISELLEHSFTKEWRGHSAQAPCVGAETSALRTISRLSPLLEVTTDSPWQKEGSYNAVRKFVREGREQIAAHEELAKDLDLLLLEVSSKKGDQKNACSNVEGVLKPPANSEEVVHGKMTASCRTQGRLKNDREFEKQLTEDSHRAHGWADSREISPLRINCLNSASCWASPTATSRKAAPPSDDDWEIAPISRAWTWGGEDQN